MKSNKLYIYGTHSVTEALLGMPHAVRKVMLKTGAGDDTLRAALQKSGVPVERLDPKKISSYAEGNAPHQGVFALLSNDKLTVSFEKYASELSPTADTLLVMTAGVQDPHNLGAIIRSAAAFGARAVLIPEKNNAPITPAVVKTSAGMCFRLRLVSVPNMREAISVLKDKGVRTYGLAGESEHSLHDEPFRAPTLLIVGNEGAGIPDEVRKSCDLLLRIPIHTDAESLNAAAAAAAALYAWSTKHVKALKGH